MNITVQNLSKAYGARDILVNFSLDIVDGMRLCICGPNGCGKSTLIRIMAGADFPDNGRIIIPKGCRLGYVEQILAEEDLDATLLTWVQSALPDWSDFWQEWDKATQENDTATINNLMVRQAELEALFGYNPEQKAQNVLSGLGFEKDKWQMPLRLLSGGWRERAKLARVLIAGADVLLLDEPTNHLDIDAVEWLEDFLLNFKGVLVFVAHDRIFMDHISTHVLYLGASKPAFKKATFTQFLVMQEELEKQKERELKRISEEIDHKMDFVRRFKAKATKARQASSRQKQAEKLEKELENFQPEAKRRELSFKWPTAARSEKVVLNATDLGFHFSDGMSLWPDLTFSLYKGQRIGLVGPNGCGKSTLLKILAGKLSKTSGSLVVGSMTRIGYYSQQQSETLNLKGTVLGEMRRLSDPRTTEEELMSVLGLFMLGQNFFDRPVASLSGGERSRLTLSLLFLVKTNLLILDEPTNHLDLESREALLEALDSYDGTLIIVAHDRYLLSNAVKEIWDIDKKGIQIYERGFDEYEIARQHKKTQTKEHNKEQIKDIRNSNSDNMENVSNYSREEQKRIKREQAEVRNKISRQIKPLQEKYEKTEQNLEKTLERQAEIETLLASAEVYNSGEQASALLKEFHAVEIRGEKELEDLSRLEEEIQILKNSLPVA